ncbi:hypothetical protein [Cellvibrio sp. UBA7671]|uniref:hypothetical protein n=1 Tax=Cellvibrio sp. UBA7671 TaxID=1946312 RepID=UPI002F3548AA
MSENNFEDKLVIRNTKSVLPSGLAEVDDFPENVVVKVNDIDRSAPLDFGSFAFTERDAKLPTTRNPLKAIRVNPNSFVAHRRQVLLFIFDHIYCTRLSEASLRKLYFECRTLFNVLDGHGYQDAFRNSACARLAFEKYSVRLAIQLACEAITSYTALTRQNIFKWLLLGCFPQDGHYITHGIASFSSKRGHHKVPEEAEVTRFAQVTYLIGFTVTDFIVENKTFPLHLEVASFKKYIFPFNSACPGQYPKAFDAVNRETGEFESLDTLMQRFPNSPKRITNYYLKRARAQLQKSNEDMRCTARLRLASIAVAAYTLLLQLITGMSPAELRGIKYSDVVEAGTGQVTAELSSIKNRARGKKTYYSLGGKIGRRILLDYLRIRNWLLDGKDCDYLFARLGRTGSYTGSFLKLDRGYSKSAIERIRKFVDDEKLKYIGPSQARKYKSLVFHELKIPNKLTASILNHTEKTNAVNYAETSPERSQIEFHNYWESVRRHAATIIHRNTNNDDSLVTPSGVGGCNSFRNPSTSFERAPLVPDCTTQFGCLYCDHYIFHADFEDLHKLLSLKYVIQEIRKCASSIEHSTKLLQDLMIRIDQVVLGVSEISENHKLIVSQSNHRVFELGDLTAFWEARLRRLELSGVVL